MRANLIKILSAAMLAQAIMDAEKRVTTQADRNPEGQDRLGLGAEHESGGRASDAPENHAVTSASTTLNTGSGAA